MIVLLMSLWQSPVLYARAGATTVAAAASATPSPQDLENIALSKAILRRVGDSIWPGWTKTPFPIDLLTANGPVELGFARPVPAPSFPPNLEATFPFSNGVPTIVIGEPQFTQAKTPVRWSITLLHEHFHQWQDSWVPYFSATQALGLAKNKTDAMWMLNYRFPYTDPRVVQAYAVMSRRLNLAISSIGTASFQGAVGDYLASRNAFRAIVAPADYKYFAFQCWQEGVARYTEFAVAKAAADAHARDAAFLSGEQSQALRADADKTFARVVKELGDAQALPRDQRVAFYAFGAGEAMILDAYSPAWHARYLDRRMDLGNFF